MSLYDISLLISNSMLVWPGVTPVNVSEVASQAKGAVANESMITMHVHTGTHIDAPLHFISGGKSVDQLDLNILIGPAWVVDARQVEKITADILDRLAIPAGSERVLFHTRNSEEWLKPEAQKFCEDYVAITEDGAHWLVNRGVRLVGVDYLSVAPYSEAAPTHQVFLSAGLILIESVDLNGIEAGEYQLICLPLKIAGSEGSPARVILMDAK